MIFFVNLFYLPFTIFVVFNNIITSVLSIIALFLFFFGYMHS